MIGMPFQLAKGVPDGIGNTGSEDVSDGGIEVSVGLTVGVALGSGVSVGRGAGVMVGRGVDVNAGKLVAVGTGICVGDVRTEAQADKDTTVTMRITVRKIPFIFSSLFHLLKTG